MTINEIIAQVKLDQDQDGTSGWSSSDILTIVQEGHTDFCRYTQANEKLSTQTVTAYQSLYSLPSDWLEGRQTRWSYNLLIYPKTQRDLGYDLDTWPSAAASKPMFFNYWNYNTMRLYPIPLAAGTITFRHAYVPTAPSGTSEPEFPKMWHSALVDYANAELFAANREYENSAAAWAEYREKRDKAKAQFGVGQRTPDTLGTMRQKSNYNWSWWNQRAR